MPKGSKYRQQICEHYLNWSNDKTADNVEPKDIDILILHINAEIDPHTEENSQHQEDRRLPKNKVELDSLE